jgi:hypothetical protein
MFQHSCYREFESRKSTILTLAEGVTGREKLQTFGSKIFLVMIVIGK